MKAFVITIALLASGSAYAQHHAHGETAHDNSVQSYVLFNRLEGFEADHGAGLEWEAQAWIGTDTDKLWLRSEGERIDGRTESAGLEALYGRPIARWWDLVAGVRHNFKPGASSTASRTIARPKRKIPASVYAV